MIDARPLLMAICGIVLLGSSAWAQAPYRYVPPAGPVMPEALNYFRRDTGVLDPYNSFVAPRRQIDQQFRALDQQADMESRRVQRQLRQVRESAAAPTGAGGGFMNYSHYYRAPVGGRARR